MAIKHRLALDIPETSCTNILKISDSSVYGEGLAVDCNRIDITLPGNTQPLYITDITENFNLNISYVDLGIQLPDCETLSEFPDGVYTIKYSVCPNEEVYVEYYHLRTTKILNSYYEELCKIDLEHCEPTSEHLQHLSELRRIKTYIDAAKAKVEYCNSPTQGIEMLRYATKLLNKFKTSCCSTCN